MKKFINILCVPTVIASLLLGGCAPNAAVSEPQATPEAMAATPVAIPPDGPFSRTELMLGTACTITLYDHKDNAIMQQAFDCIDQIGKEVSVNQSGTEIDKVNAQAGIAPVQVSPDAYNIIKRGLAYCAVSDGKFDISIGPLTGMWHIGFDDARVPSQQEIDAALPLVNYTQVELNDAEQTVYLPRKDMKLDLGGIAKGYIADKAADVLRANDVSGAIVNLGGSSIVMVGSKPENQPFVAGVQNPQNARGEDIGAMWLTDMSIGTSGIYERTLEQNGKTYHHMLDPLTGYPFDNEVASVTVVSKRSLDGDGYSTTLCGLGLEEGLAKAESIPEIEAVFVTKDQKIYLTSGLKDNFVLTDDTYTLMP